MPTIEELAQKIDSLERQLAAVGKPPADPAQQQRLPSEPHLVVGPDGKAADPAAQQADAKAEPAYTWEQLQNAVNEGRITEAVAQQIWADQNRRLAVKEASETVVNTLTAHQTASKVEAEIARYRDLIPQVMDPNSEQRQRVVREFNRLVTDLGFSKNDLRTELAALQAAFGPVDSVAKAVKKPKKEGHQDVSSDEDPGSADDSKDTDPDNTPPSSLSADERRYYENAMRIGVYKNWGEVRKELKYANPRVRRRYGARV